MFVGHQAYVAGGSAQQDCRLFERGQVKSDPDVEAAEVQMELEGRFVTAMGIASTVLHRTEVPSRPIIRSL
jgi:hypothetical protein